MKLNGTSSSRTRDALETAAREIAQHVIEQYTQHMRQNDRRFVYNDPPEAKQFRSQSFAIVYNDIDTIYQARRTFDRIDETKNVGTNVRELLFTMTPVVSNMFSDVIIAAQDTVREINENPVEAFNDLTEDFLDESLYRDIATMDPSDLRYNADSIRRMVALGNVEQTAEEYRALTGVSPDPERVAELKEIYLRNKPYIDIAVARIEYMSTDLYSELGTDPELLKLIKKPSETELEFPSAVTEARVQAQEYKQGIEILKAMPEDIKVPENIDVVNAQTAGIQNYNLVVNMGNQQLGKESGQMSMRVPLTFSAASGETVKGYFTENATADYSAQASRNFTGLMAKYPQYQDFLNAAEALGSMKIYDAIDFRIMVADSPSKHVEQTCDPASLQSDPGRLAGYLTDILPDLNMTEESFSNKLQSEPQFREMIHELIPVQFKLVQSVIAGNYHGIREGNVALNLRNNAMSETADILGLNGILAKSVNMTLISGGKPVQGTFMYNAKGYDVNKIGQDLTPELTGRIIEVGPEVLEQINNLKILDHICANTDRHMANMLYDIDLSTPGKGIIRGIQGIDNDLSFNSRTDGSVRTAELKEINLMSRSMAERVLQMDEMQFETVMRRAGLRPAEIGAGKIRLNNLQEKIRSGQVELIDPADWTKKDFKELRKTSTYHSTLAIAVDTIQHSMKTVPAKQAGPAREISAGIEQTELSKYHLEMQSDRLKEIRKTLVENDPKYHINRPSYNRMFEALDRVINLSDKFAKQPGEPSPMQMNLLGEAYNKLGKTAETYLAKHPGVRQHEFGNLRNEMAKNLQVLTKDFRHAAAENVSRADSEAVRFRSRLMNSAADIILETIANDVLDAEAAQWKGQGKEGLVRSFVKQAKTPEEGIQMLKANLAKNPVVVNELRKLGSGQLNTMNAEQLRNHCRETVNDFRNNKQLRAETSEAILKSLGVLKPVKVNPPKAPVL